MDVQIHLIDESWIAAPAATVAAVVADEQNWTRWWPDLVLTVSRDRGVKGMQWTARSTALRPPLRGSAEIWLEPFAEGVIVHHYLRLDPVDGARLSRRRAAAIERRLARHAKQAFWPVKDSLERAAR